MISPIMAMQNSMPIATMQQHQEAQSVLQSQNATQAVEKEEEQIRETVIQKDEAVFYEQNPDAKEEGKNKYQNLYSGKKKKSDDKDEKEHHGVNRVNFDIRL